MKRKLPRTSNAAHKHKKVTTKDTKDHEVSFRGSTHLRELLCPLWFKVVEFYCGITGFTTPVPVSPNMPSA